MEPFILAYFLVLGCSQESLLRETLRGARDQTQGTQFFGLNPWRNQAFGSWGEHRLGHLQKGAPNGHSVQKCSEICHEESGSRQTDEKVTSISGADEPFPQHSLGLAGCLLQPPPG